MSETPDKDDKQYEPSEQKLRRAREKGDVPRSTEATTALVWLGFFGVFVVGVPALLPSWMASASQLIAAAASPETSAAAVRGAALLSMGAVLGAALLPAMLVVLGLVLQRALLFTPSRLAPDLKRINPLHNAGQKFGRTGLVGFAISLGKLAAVSAGGVVLFVTLGSLIAAAAATTAAAWIAALPVLIRQVLMLALAVAIVFAAIDIVWKHLDFRQRNRMTRKEMEDEHKESEGDPHLKAARRQKAVDLALGSMLADVERADVVIVNPTHYAVALEWKRGSGKAPVCLAKGVDEVAARIRERARSHQVPIWSDPPCARALHATTKIGEEVPREQFGPVAAAIRFAEAMRLKARRGYGGVLEGGVP